ncbi:MAG: hypothetical protein IT237_04340 [Bacteroidia bacterium]|nr:hypothetical protein [Bacteroidia bacterium]
MKSTIKIKQMLKTSKIRIEKISNRIQKDYPNWQELRYDDPTPSGFMQLIIELNAEIVRKIMLEQILKN